jgi:hypothetical protein
MDSEWTMEDVQRAIDEAVARTKTEVQEELTRKHTEDMEVLRSQLAGGTPLSVIPEHAGGPGTKIAGSWSLAEQTAARAAAWAAKEL